jgi:hypothetical protein
MILRTSAKWLFLKLKRFQVGFKYYFANAHKMGFYWAFSVASLLQAVSSIDLRTLASCKYSYRRSGFPNSSNTFIPPIKISLSDGQAYRISVFVLEDQWPGELCQCHISQLKS